ncbi:MAG: hypothetical protein EOO51_02920 [Flavobacterium sp.]|nr:MAG: hypothetical protein EOO51_02920 [Flavobacterium sp.]
MKRTFFILVLFIQFQLTVTSCQSAAKLAYGVKAPRLESDASVKQYLRKNKVSVDTVYYFKDILAFAQASKMKLLSFPDALFFNENGQMVSYKKSAEDCNAGVDHFIKDLKNLSNAPEPEAVTLSDLSNLLLTNLPSNSNRITVVLTFTIYSGRVNDDHAFAWIALLDQAKKNNVAVDYYLLNCDYQKSWNLNQKLIDKLGIKD